MARRERIVCRELREATEEGDLGKVRDECRRERRGGEV
jgi:hypothetical protein